MPAHFTGLKVVHTDYAVPAAIGIGNPSVCCEQVVEAQDESGARLLLALLFWCWSFFEQPCISNLAPDSHVLHGHPARILQILVGWVGGGEFFVSNADTSAIASDRLLLGRPAPIAGDRPGCG